jgi:hypothetical protein
MPSLRPLRPADAARHLAAIRPWQRRRLPSKIRLDGPAAIVARPERAAFAGANRP